MNIFDWTHFTKYSLEGAFRSQQYFTNYVCKWYFWEPGFYKRIWPEFSINNNFNLRWIFTIDPILERTHCKVHFGFSNVLQIICGNGIFKNLVFIRGFDLNIELTITALLYSEFLQWTQFYRTLILRYISTSAILYKLCVQMVLLRTLFLYKDLTWI